MKPTTKPLDSLAFTASHLRTALASISRATHSFKLVRDKDGLAARAESTVLRTPFKPPTKKTVSPSEYANQKRLSIAELAHRLAQRDAQQTQLPPPSE